LVPVSTNAPRAALDDEVAGIEARAVESRVDDVDAVRVRLQEVGQGHDPAARGKWTF
jgi:hypothetical protein